ncbi:MAG TPA: prepilin-type N-terminal cleavage/methylation domain-containing protein [Rhizomicrobium sp.]|jgi:general secretion pathway protein J
MTEIRARTWPSCSEAGFTLLELLIATTILGFLSLLLFGGLQFGTRVWEKAQISTTDTNRVRAAQLFLSDEIARIYPSFTGLTPADRQVQFQGEDQRMTFLAPSKTATGAMDWVTVETQKGRNGVSVVVTREGELSNGHGTARRQTLIGGFKWFQISYYGAPAPAGGGTSRLQTANAGLGRNQAVVGPPPQWTSVWKGQSALPQLIRIRAAFVDKAQWPDLVASPRIDVDEACVFDELSKYCQGR